MRAWIARALLFGLAATTTAFAQSESNQNPPENFIYFGRDRDRIVEPKCLSNQGVIGAQIKYIWKELEPERDRYSFDAIRSDLECLERHGKRLFIQLQDVSFDTALVNVPDYLLEDPAFHGGAAIHYGGHDEQGPTLEGWVARRWDPAVRQRMARLLEAFATEFDGRVAGVNLPETAIGFGRDPELHPAGFSYDAYYEGIRELMSMAREAFHESDVIIYANLMPGVAVQWGNLEDKNRQTGEGVTVEGLYAYGRNELELDYIFWGMQEPFYSRDILPFLQRLD